jgi:hypothetical protein
MSMIKISAFVLGVALAAAPSMALAASSTCHAALRDGFCHTGNVPAHPQFHFVHVDVSGPCNLFTVVDRVNGVTVYQSSAGWGGHERTIGGLYSEYSVYLYGGSWPITSVTINN